MELANMLSSLPLSVVIPIVLVGLVLFVVIAAGAAVAGRVFSAPEKGHDDCVYF